jgi:ribosomal protein L24
MDVTVSFHPEDLNSIIFHKIDVRYVARNDKRQKVIAPPVASPGQAPPHQVTTIRVVVVKSATEQPKTEIIEAAAALQRSNVDKARSFIDKQDKERKKVKKEAVEVGVEKEVTAVTPGAEGAAVGGPTPPVSPEEEKEGSKRTGDDAASSKS